MVGLQSDVVEIDRCKRDRESELQSLHRSNHRVDIAIIESETDLEELQNFDFQKLWSELRLPGPSELSRVPHARVAEMKDKVSTIGEIPTFKNSAQAATQPSRAELCEKKRAEIESVRKRYRQECEEHKAAARTPQESKRWENFYADAENELDEELKKWLR